mgnify:CR=1 FL=1|tara:strand:+ start:478 stop:732 length:255 start_codon:yes stop_codon:yes gene_type:complete
MKYFIDWDFNLVEDVQTQEFLGMIEEDIEFILNDPERLAAYKNDVAELFAVPQIIEIEEGADLDDVCEQLTNKYGWLIEGITKL